MPNLLVNKFKRPQHSWPGVLLVVVDRRLIDVFTRLNTKVCRRLINEYICLIKKIVIGNQWFMELLKVAPIR